MAQSSLFNLAPQRGQSSLFSLTQPKPAPSGIYSGGLISDIFDTLRLGEFAVGGALSAKRVEDVPGAIKRGVLTRHSSQTEFERIFKSVGAPDHFATKAGAFVASIVLDPINLVGPVGLGRAAVSVVGKAGIAATTKLAPRVAARMAARKSLEPILERAMIAEGKGVEEGVNLGRQIRREAIQVTGNKHDARRLDQAVGGYFDAGADTMLDQLSLLTKANLPSKAAMAQARQAGEAAQRVYLNSLPQDVRQFVQKWSPRIEAEDVHLAQNLVRVGMMKPETAAKWEGFHLRRIYSKFEDPSEFAEYLAKFDPVEVASVMGGIERGVVRVTATGRRMPTGVTKPRKEALFQRTGRLGEIQQASSRYVSEKVLTERLIARGEAFKEIADKFALPDDLVRTFGFPRPGEWRQLTGAGWGALSDKWLPKEISDPLLVLRKQPEGIDKFLEKTTGWFKYNKVILNPATHWRNIRTNISLAFNSAGVGALNPITWVRAIKEVATNGQAFQQAKSVNSAFLDTFTSSELREFVTDGTERGVLAALRRMGVPFARLYQAEEQIGKMAVYLTMTQKGLSPQAAAKVAEIALFNYRRVPGAIDKMRRVGIYPFITFPYKVATQTVPQVIENPSRMSAMAKSIGQISEPMTGEEQRNLPLYMRSGGYIKLPLKVDGHPVLWDLTYELAFGDIAEAGTPLGNIIAAFRGELPRESLITLLPPAAQIVAEIALNKPAFTGRAIVPEGETGAETRSILFRHAARFAAPSVVSKAVLPGGELRRSLEASRPGGATGISPSGQPAAPVPQAVASSLFGLRTVSLDTEREKRFRILELQQSIKDVESRMRGVAFRVANKHLTQEQGQQRMRELQAEMQRLMNQYKQRGAVRR